MPRLSDEERLLSKASWSDTGCLIWQAHLNKDGYGDFSLKGRMEKAHRAAWKLFVGEIPQGLYVMHVCDTPACVNVEHLRLGTQLDNMRDMASKGRSSQQKATHCKTCGLALEVVDFKNNKRGCRSCRLERARQWRRN